MSALVTVEGWQLDVADADEPRIRDVDLAGRGYASRLAKAAIRAGQLGLPGVH